ADFMGADNRFSRAGEEGKTLYFRSADVHIHHPSVPPAAQGVMLKGVVEESAFLGHLYRHSVRCAGQLVLADSAQRWPAQTAVVLHVPAPALHVFATTRSCQSTSS